MIAALFFAYLVAGHKFCYRQAYNITNPLDEHLEGEEFFFTMSTLGLVWEDKLRDDCRDMRIRTFNSTNGEEWLDFYAENGCPHNDTRIWVKTDFEPNERKTMEVLYFCNDVRENIPEEYGIPYSYVGSEDTRFVNYTEFAKTEYFYVIYPVEKESVADFSERGYERVHPLGYTQDENPFAYLLLRGNGYGEKGVDDKSSNVFADNPMVSHQHTSVYGNLTYHENGAKTNNLTGNPTSGQTMYFYNVHSHECFREHTTPCSESMDCLPDTVVLELYESHTFDFFPGQVFFVNDTDIPVSGADFVDDADGRFVSFKRLSSPSIELTGGSIHSHSLETLCESPEIFITTFLLIEEGVKSVNFNGIAAITSSNYHAQTFDTPMAPPCHKHNITCEFSSADLSPDYIEMALFEHTAATVDYESFSSNRIIFATALPPMGFVEVRSVPDEFIRIASDNNFDVNLNTGHQHDIVCGNSGIGNVEDSLDYCDIDGVFYRVFHPETRDDDNEDFSSWEFPYFNHYHNHEANASEVLFDSVDQNKWGGAYFRFLSRKESIIDVVMVIEEEKVGAAADCVREPIDDNDDEVVPIPPDPTWIEDNPWVVAVGAVGGGFGLFIIILCVCLCGCCCVVGLAGCVFCVVLCLTSGGGGFALHQYSKKKHVVEDEAEEMQDMLDKEKEAISESKRRLREEQEKKTEEVEAKRKRLEQVKKETEEAAAQSSMNLRSLSIVPQSNIRSIDFMDVVQEGDMGKGDLGFSLYRGTWEGNSVLVKVFEGKMLKTKRFNVFDFFEKELNLYSGFDHENVMRYEAYSGLPDVCVVTSYCSLGPLKSYIKNNSMTFEDKTKVVRDIVEAMFFLHKRGYVHGALTSGNVYLHDEPEISGIVDFGFTSTFNQDVEVSHYSAPELINSQPSPDDDDELPTHEKFETKRDIFSFGILMYEIAVGNFNPYDTSKSEKIATQVADDPDMRPNFDHASDIPNWYVNLAQMCWAHKAIERPSFERVKNILKNVSSMVDEGGSGDEDTSSTESDISD